MTRPRNLPSFGEPPLDEVVLGVQFSPVPAYKSVDIRPIWELFRSEFPNVEDQPALAPVFETFGGTTPQLGFQFQIGPFPLGNRVFFVDEPGSHLLQFQPDRFLLNWRKHQGLTPYPRYEQISASFKKKLARLAKYLETTKGYTLEINQAEISYINVIPVDDFADFGRWIALWNPPDFKIEGLNLTFPQVVTDAKNRPVARVHHDISAAVAIDGSARAFRLSMTYRGKPVGPGIEDALHFLNEGRKEIVQRFASITTTEAHKAWKRTA